MNTADQHETDGNDDTAADEQAQIDDVQRRATLRLAQERQELLETWLETGGTTAEFDAAWPAIHAQLNKARVQDVGEAARRRTLSRFRKRT